MLGVAAKQLMTGPAQWNERPWEGSVNPVPDLRGKSSGLLQLQASHRRTESRNIGDVERHMVSCLRSQEIELPLAPKMFTTGLHEASLVLSLIIVFPKSSRRR